MIEARENDPVKESSFALAVGGWAGAPALPVALWSASRFQFNVANYTVELRPDLSWPPALVFVMVSAFALPVWALWRQTGAGFLSRLMGAGATLAPLVVCVPVAMYVAVVERVPFFVSHLLIAAAAWTAYRIGSLRCGETAASTRAHAFSVALLVVLILVMVVMHTAIQRNYYEHFMLGHADIGHYLEELKNSLVGRGLRSDSFDYVRHGWHFVPLMHGMVPLFRLWPSVTFWMVFGGIIMHLPAIVAYFTARHFTRSVGIALCWGLAWLLLPTTSRLIYANTYGFQWTCAAIPLVMLMIHFQATGRVLASLVMAVLVLFVQETTSAAILGWGLALMLCKGRRFLGMTLAVLAGIYFMICVMWVIPYFSGGKGFQRFDLFGPLGSTTADLIQAPVARPAEFLGRFARAEVFHYLAMLLIPLAGLPLRGWRLAIAAAPTLLLILLVDNAEFLSIKFWHIAAALPFLFVTGMNVEFPRRTGCFREAPGDEEREGRRRRVQGGCAAALLAALVSHYFFAFSPISQPFASYARSPVLQQPDPRLAVVQSLRDSIPRHRTIQATERLAAHFWDYRRVFTGARPRNADVVMIDRADSWDRSGLRETVEYWSDHADYVPAGERGTILVFLRRQDGIAE